MSKLTWWEVVEDLGDGDAVVRRFSTEQLAQNYVNAHEEKGYGDIFLDGPYEVSFGCDGFFSDSMEDSLFGERNHE